MSRHKAAERLVWAVDTLAVQPGDEILEIGCGHGVAVSLVCERLSGGHITAIDRSPKMIAMARKRNADHVDAGTALFHTASLHDADLGSERFDTIFAVHVPVFARGDPARELGIVKDRLAPGGRFHLVYEPLDAHAAEPTAKALSGMLEDHGFAITDVRVEDLSATRVASVTAASERSDAQ